MFLKISDKVLVVVEAADGSTAVCEGWTHDGVWNVDILRLVKGTVTHWMPKPPKEGKGDD